MTALRVKTSQKLRNCPTSRYSKYSSYSRIVKFGRKCEIWSTPISLVLKGLTEFITIGQTQTFSRIAIRGCSLNISKNRSSGVLSKCICHRHCLCRSLSHCLFFIGKCEPYKQFYGRLSLVSLVVLVLLVIVVVAVLVQLVVVEFVHTCGPRVMRQLTIYGGLSHSHLTLNSPGKGSTRVKWIKISKRECTDVELGCQRAFCNWI